MINISFVITFRTVDTFMFQSKYFPLESLIGHSAALPRLNVKMFNQLNFQSVINECSICPCIATQAGCRNQKLFFIEKGRLKAPSFFPSSFCLLTGFAYFLHTKVSVELHYLLDKEQLFVLWQSSNYSFLFSDERALQSTKWELHGRRWQHYQTRLFLWVSTMVIRNTNVAVCCDSKLLVFIKKMG